jgi:hypothetical protein
MVSWFGRSCLQPLAARRRSLASGGGGDGGGDGGPPAASLAADRSDRRELRVACTIVMRRNAKYSTVTRLALTDATDTRFFFFSFFNYFQARSGPRFDTPPDMCVTPTSGLMSVVCGVPCVSARRSGWVCLSWPASVRRPGGRVPVPVALRAAGPVPREPPPPPLQEGAFPESNWHGRKEV